MSNPRNNFDREQAKANSSHSAARPSSATVPDWQGHSHHGNPAYSQAPPNYTAATPQFYSNTPQQMPPQSFEGFRPHPPQYHDRGMDPGTVYPPASAAPSTDPSRSQIIDAFEQRISHIHFPDPHLGVAPTGNGAGSIFDTTRLAPTGSMQQSDGHGRPALHESPPPYRAEQAAPGMRTAGNVRVRTERSRRRLLNEQAHGQPYRAEQSQYPSHGSQSGFGHRPGDGSTPTPWALYGPMGAPSGVYHYPSQFSQPPTDQYRAFASNFGPAFDQQFEHPIFQDSPNMNNTGTGFGMAFEGPNSVGGPYRHSPGYFRSDSVDPALQSHAMAGYMQNVNQAVEAAEQEYEPQGHAPNTLASHLGGFGDRTAPVERAALARARAIAVQRTRQMQYLQFRSQRAAPRAPPPAQIQHFSTLSATDSSHDRDCPICQDPYDDDGHSAIQLQNVACTHVFGLSCLQEWVNSGMQNSHRCPSCRQSLAGALAGARPGRPSDAIDPPEAPMRGIGLRTGSYRMSSSMEEQMRVMQEQITQAHQDSHPAHPQDPPSAFGPATGSHPPPTPRIRPRGQAFRDLRERTEELMRRARATHQQQLVRFDADAALRTANAQVVGMQEASALVTRIANERTALILRQQAQINSVRDSMLRQVQHTRSRAEGPN